MYKRSPRITSLGLEWIVAGVYAIIVGLMVWQLPVIIAPDSVSYMSTAQSILKGQGFVLYNGTPFVQWPPLFPIMLTFLAWLGLSLLSAAKIINILSYLFVTLLATGLCRQLALPRRWTLWCTSATVVAISLFHYAPAVLTDIAFTMLVTLFVGLSVSFVRTGSRRLLIAIALTAALAMLLRYMGVAVVGAGFILTMFFPYQLSWKNRLRQTVLYGLLAVPLPLLWLLHNVMMSSTAAGQFYSYGYTFFQHLRLSVAALGSWFFPVRIPMVIQLCVAAIFVITGVLLWSKPAEPKKDQRDWQTTPVLVMVGFIILFYSLTLLASWRFTTAELEDYQRYLTPILVPLLCLIAITLYRLTRYLQRHGTRGRLFGGLVTVLAYLWLVFPIYRDVDYARSIMAEGGGGYTARHWRESQTLKELASIGGQAILSNAPAAVYFYTGRTARSVPFQWKRDSIPCPQVSVQDSALLVWFLPGAHWSKENRRKNAMITPRIYDEHCGLKRLRATKDGEIYLFAAEADEHDLKDK